jgi:hypothetical protein
VLAELYDVFMELLKPEQVQKFYEAVSGTGDPEASISEISESAAGFIAVAERYIKGVEGTYAPFPRKGKPPVIDPKEIKKLFSNYAARLCALPRAIETLKNPHGLQGLKTALETKPALTGFALGYGAVALFRAVLGKGASGSDAAALMDYWHLSRKLQGAFRELEVSGADSYRAAELIQAVLRRTAPEKPSLPLSSDIAENIILENYQAEDFRRILQVNQFNDRLWFNKEAFEDALLYTPLFLALESPAAFQPGMARTIRQEYKDDAQWHKHISSISGLVEKFQKAEIQSEYRFDGLLEALTKKPAKSSALKKKTKK